MATQVQWRGGSTAEHSTFTGAAREVTVDTQKKTLVVHDGSTAGGEPLLREDQVNLPTSVTNGISVPSANNVAISTNASQRLLIDASGNLKNTRAIATAYSATNAATWTNGLSLHNSSTPGTGVSSFINFTGNANVNSAFGVTQAGSSYGDFVWASYNGSFSERMRLDSIGRLGLGTSSAQTRLHVQDSIAGGSGGTVATLQNFSDTGADNRYVGLNFRIGSDNGTSAIRAYRTNSASNYETNLSFWTNPAGATQDPVRAMTIDSSQRVGIGVTAPTKSLEVAAGSTPLNGILVTGSSSPRIAVTSTGGSVTNFMSADDGAAYAGTGSNHPYVIYTNSAERARIDSSGRFLVGTSSWANTSRAVFSGNSSDNLETYVDFNRGTAATATDSYIALLNFRNGGSDTCASIHCQTDAACGPGDSPGRLVFATTADGASSPTERMRITSGGDLNAFSSGSDHKFRTTETATATAALSVRNGATNNTNGTVVFIVRADGDCENTNNSYGAISDIKLKENIVDANSQWNDLKDLRVVNYNFKEGQTHTQIGLIAQEVETVCPGLVSESPDLDEDGNDLGTVTKSVNYSVLYMKAVKALQEAIERIEVLEAKVNTLEGN